MPFASASSDEGLLLYPTIHINLLLKSSNRENPYVYFCAIHLTLFYSNKFCIQSTIYNNNEYFINIDQILRWHRAICVVPLPLRCHDDIFLVPVLFARKGGHMGGDEPASVPFCTRNTYWLP